MNSRILVAALYDAYGNKVSMTTYRTVGGDALGAPHTGDTALATAAGGTYLPTCLPRAPLDLNLYCGLIVLLADNAHRGH